MPLPFAYAIALCSSRLVVPCFVSYSYSFDVALLLLSQRVQISRTVRSVARVAGNEAMRQCLAAVAPPSVARTLRFIVAPSQRTGGGRGHEDGRASRHPGLRASTPHSRTAAQPHSRTAAQPHSRTAAQPHSRECGTHVRLRTSCIYIVRSAPNANPKRCFDVHADPRHLTSGRRYPASDVSQSQSREARLGA
jgi:hypothetical protein